MRARRAVALGVLLGCVLSVLVFQPAHAQTVGERVGEDYRPYASHEEAYVEIPETVNGVNACVSWGIPKLALGNGGHAFWGEPGLCGTGHLVVYPKTTPFTLNAFMWRATGQIGCRVEVFTFNAATGQKGSSLGTRDQTMYSGDTQNAGKTMSYSWNLPGQSPTTAYLIEMRVLHNTTGDQCGVYATGSTMYEPASWQEPAADEFVPQLACGRTLENIGDGQWLAHTEVHLRNPPKHPLTLDTEGFWKVSWDSTFEYQGSRAIIPLPPGAQPDDTLLAMYTMTRELSTRVGWSPEMGDTGDWVYIDPTVPDPPPHMGAWINPLDMSGWVWVGKAMRHDYDKTMELGAEESVPSAGFWFDTDGDGVGDQLNGEALSYNVQQVKGFCTMSVSPATQHTDPSVVVIILPDHPDDTDPPTMADPPPPLTDSGSVCGGGSLWNPVTWAKSVFCKLGDIWDVLGELLGGVIGLLEELLAWLAERFGSLSFDWVGDLVPEWEAKFPLSVVTEARDALGVLHGALEDGVNGGGSGIGGTAVAGCGPMIDPNLDSRASFLNGLPGGDVAGKLDGFKWSLPTPTSCAHQSAEAQQLADLHGARGPIRAFLTVALYAGFFVKVASSFGPKRNGLEPDPVAAGAR